MAEKTKKNVDAAGRRVKKKGEPELAFYLDKDPSDMQEFFAEWIEEKTGYKVDLTSTILASVLRGRFQKSPENQKRLEEQAERVAAEKIAREQRREERAAKRAEKEAAKSEKKTAPAKSAKAAPKSKAAPARKPAAKDAPAKAAAKPRRRPSKADSDF